MSASTSFRVCPRLLSATVAFATFVLVVGCDPSVDVLRPSDRYRYSLFGALNVAADTQWVRVDPIPDSSQIGAPPELGVTLTLENVDTGEEVTMRDSFMVVNVNAPRVHNFWTTMPIRTSTTYRVVLREGDEPVTTASVMTPERAPELRHDFSFFLPCLFGTFNDPRRDENTFIVEARNIEHIASADVLYPIEFGEGLNTRGTLPSFSHYGAVVDKGSFFEVPFFYRQELLSLNPDPSGGGATRVCESGRLQATACARLDRIRGAKLAGLAVAPPRCGGPSRFIFERRGRARLRRGRLLRHPEGADSGPSAPVLSLCIRFAPPSVQGCLFVSEKRAHRPYSEITCISREVNFLWYQSHSE